MKVLVIQGSPREKSRTGILANLAFKNAKKGNEVKMIDLSLGNVDVFAGKAFGKETKNALDLIYWADVLIVCTPVYNSMISSALKNLFEFVDYKKIGGKVSGFIINASTMKSTISVQNQLSGLMNYFGIISNPKAVFAVEEDFDENGLKNKNVEDRIRALVESSSKIKA